MFGLLLGLAVSSNAAPATLVGWNNLGMHCMDSDYSAFSILPPYNTIEAQLIVNGLLVTNGSGYTVSYEAMADPSGSFNSTSQGKGNFYTYTAALYGPLAVDAGLAGWNMPGTANTPQSMVFEVTNLVRVNWFRAEGIPLMPYDDSFHKNAYPMMRLVARDAANNIVATNSIVLPVSDEMDCRACHASGSYSNTLPAAGWVNDANPERDYRLNILRLHDEKIFALNPGLYSAALKAKGFNASGLFLNVVTDAKPVLCASCHASAALGTVSYASTPPLTQSVHTRHATAPDPSLAITLDDSLNRAACYRCHPGSTTRCLRGAMGASVAADGSMAMQCQSCHGKMSQVGASDRLGWLMEPKCQSCHTGTATSYNGQIRYASVYDVNGGVRVAVDQTYATTADSPAAGLSLYRFSSGHGGLQCEACHGSTHAEFPSSHINDNLRDIQLQGHAGAMVECDACHTTVPDTLNGGPHGMHPIGQTWIRRHHELLQGGADVSHCQSCHGADFTGTVLSRAQGDRTWNAGFDEGATTLNLFQGATIGCFTCHNGPHDDNPRTSIAPSVSNVTASTVAGQPVSMTLPLSGQAALRIVSQSAHGTVGLINQTATYFPFAGFSGVDTFTFAAYDGAKNSSLGTATISVSMSVDNSAPSVVITSPTTASTWTASSATLLLSGTAADNDAITGVSWANSRGGSGSAVGTTAWSATIPLQSGANVITVTATDAANNTGLARLSVTYTPSAMLVVTTNGNGVVTPNLNGRLLQITRKYTLVAKPSANWLFVNWSGSVATNSPAISFTLQSPMNLQANFVPNPFIPVAGSYKGIFFKSDTPAAVSSGASTLSVTSGGVFNGVLQSGASHYSFNGKLDLTGVGHATIKRTGTTPLTVTVQMDFTPGSGRLTGTVSDGTWTSNLSAEKVYFDGRTKVAPQAGRYTLTVAGMTDPVAAPYGIGFATVSITPGGNIVLVGTLADGTAINQQATLAQSGDWPLYIPLYGNRGFLLSTLTVEGGALSGQATWYKPPTASKYYGQGFTLRPAISGSSYVAPTGNRVLNFTNAIVMVSGANLSQGITNAVTLTPSSKFVGASNATVIVTRATGAFKGSVIDPATLKPISFSGVLVQSQNIGSGFFLGTNQSGRVYFGQ